MKNVHPDRLSFPGNIKRQMTILAGVGLLAGIAQGQPTITQQPTNQYVTYGETATFSVAVAGAGPFTYQWQFNSVNLSNNIITTVAGGGTPVYPSVGDGGPATEAVLDGPTGVAVDGTGNLYIADADHFRVRKVTPDGIIATEAGNGNSGYADSSGLATNIAISPVSVAADGSGNLLIADPGSHRVEILFYGLIDGLAGNGFAGYYGDGGAAISANLYSPVAVAVAGNGDIYIADQEEHRVRMDSNGIITTLAGKALAGYSGDGGVATNAELNSPSGLAVDSAGNVFISDDNNNRVRKVGTNGIITTVAGGGVYGGTNGIGDGGPATNALLQNPMGLALDRAGNLFIVANGRIRELWTNGIITTVAGNGGSGSSPLGDGGPATNASFWFYNNYYNSGVAVDQVGNLFIADTYNERIREVGFGGFPTLTLNTVGRQQFATNFYRVIVTDSSGSVTSNIAALKEVQRPVISVLTNSASGLTLSVVSSSAASCHVFATTNLNPPVVWQMIYVFPFGRSGQFTDTNVSGIGSKYYRVSTP
jgi:hypothetical protein